MVWLAFHAVFGLCALTIAGLGCGAWIAKALTASIHPLERWGLSLLGGLGLFSLALFLIGQVSFTRGTITAALIVAVLMAIPSLLRVWPKTRQAPLTIPRKALLPASTVLIVLAVTAFSGLAEMTGDWNKDSVAYHLFGPRSGCATESSARCWTIRTPRFRKYRKHFSPCCSPPEEIALLIFPVG